jgi:hypothetical protein
MLLDKCLDWSWQIQSFGLFALKRCIKTKSQLKFSCSLISCFRNIICTQEWLNLFRVVEILELDYFKTSSRYNSRINKAITAITNNRWMIPCALKKKNPRAQPITRIKAIKYNVFFILKLFKKRSSILISTFISDTIKVLL